MHNYVNYHSPRIARMFADGLYACLEPDGSIVVRDLKKESIQWGDNRGTYLDYDWEGYPWSKGWNYQYMEFYHWGESPVYGCDYEREGCHIKEGDVVLDIGANIGLFSRFAMERGAKKVYAFEPSESVFTCLLMNVDADVVNAYKACVYSSTGVQNVASSKVTHPMVSVVEDTFDTEAPHIVWSDKVFCYTMDYLFESGLLPSSIDFMKVDVEGAEVGVFEGMSDQNLARIDRLAIETHHKLNVDDGRGSVERMELLENALQPRLISAFPHHHHIQYDRGNHSGWTETMNLWR